MSLAGLVGASALLSYLYGPKDSAGGREINWSEFRNTLIPSGEVDRIVVTNKNVARVIMKPGSRVAQNIGGSPISGRGTALGGNYQGGENKGDQWGDSTSIELSADISGGEKEKYKQRKENEQQLRCNTVLMFSNVQHSLLHVPPLLIRLHLHNLRFVHLPTSPHKPFLPHPTLLLLHDRFRRIIRTQA